MKRDASKGIATRMWRKKNLPGIDFNKTQYCTHHFKPHFHDHYVIQMVERGVNKGICKGKSYQLKPREIIIINPGEIHTGHSWRNQFLEYKGLCPTVDFIKSFIQKIDPSKNELPVFKNFPINDKLLVEKFQRLFLMVKFNSNLLEIETAAIDFFGYLIGKYENHHVSYFTIKNEKCRAGKIKQFIRDNYERNFSLEELSKYSMVSQYHLIRIFKKETDLTPFEYLRNFRIERAKTLLRENKSIIDAIYETGFYDQSHFIRHFKSITGMTPKVYC